MREYFISKYKEKENAEKKVTEVLSKRIGVTIGVINKALNNPWKSPREIEEFLDYRLKGRKEELSEKDLAMKKTIQGRLGRLLYNSKEDRVKKNEYLKKYIDFTKEFDIKRTTQNLDKIRFETSTKLDYFIFFARLANEFPDIVNEITYVIGLNELEYKSNQTMFDEFLEYLNSLIEKNEIVPTKEDNVEVKTDVSVSTTSTEVNQENIVTNSHSEVGISSINVEVVDNLKVFLQDINSSKTDYLLDKLVILIGELEQDETRENELFLLKNLFKYFKSFGVQPLRKIGSTVTGGIESIIFGEYIGTPFKEKEVKDLEIIRAGWRYKEEIISPIVYKEKVKNMEENNG